MDRTSDRGSVGKISNASVFRNRRDIEATINERITPNKIKQKMVRHGHSQEQLNYEKPAFPGSFEDKRAVQEPRGKKMPNKYLYDTLGAQTSASDAKMHMRNPQIAYPGTEHLQTVDIMNPYNSSSPTIKNSNRVGRPDNSTRLSRAVMDKSITMTEAPAYRKKNSVANGRITPNDMYNDD